MIYKAGCKINLGLSILGKRPDGYHNLESVLYPVPWNDLIEIVPSDEFSFSSSGLTIDGSSEDNLCVKAYRLVKDSYELPSVKIHLHKVIPFGAGLGGGSSDAVAVIKLISSLFKLEIPESEMFSMAGKLGSDCPFFVNNKPAFATGTGMELHPVDIDLKGYYLAIIKPKGNVSTSEAYGNIKIYSSSGSVLQAVNQPVEKWNGLLMNDFESSIFMNQPELGEIKENLYKSGAQYAAMTGSGSALFGIFKEYPILPWFSDYTHKVMAL